MFERRRGLLRCSPFCCSLFAQIFVTAWRGREGLVEQHVAACLHPDPTSPHGLVDAVVQLTSTSQQNVLYVGLAPQCRLARWELTEEA